MKQKIRVIILGLLLVLSLTSGVLATTNYVGTTVVAGKIYNADYTQEIAGATVTINCNSNNQTTTSRTDGSYNVEYSEAVCNNGDSLTVSAVKGDLYGSKTGIIYENVIGDWDLAVVNVPLVPEFGLIVGMVTLLGAVGLFFFVRK